MNTKCLSIASAVAIALLAACSSACSSARASSDAGTDSSIDGSSALRDASEAADARFDAPTDTDASAAAEYVTVTFDGEPVVATLVDCADVDGSTYRSLVVNADLANGYRLTVNFIYAFAGAGGHAPLGTTTIGRDGDRLLAIQLMMSGDSIPWQANGTLHLAQAGETGFYEGSAEGTFMLNDPFAPTPPAPIPFTFAWRSESTQ